MFRTGEGQKRRISRGQARAVRRASLSALWAARLFFLAAALAGGSFAGEPGAAGEAIVPHAPISLFNGRDLSGWSRWLVDAGKADPRDVFSVTNGAIRISGDGLGYLATRREYRDYRLIVEYRWGDRNWHWGDRVGKARDSGIFLHSVGPDGNSEDGGGAFRAGIECNIFEGAEGDFLLIRGRDSRGRLIAPRLTAEVADATDTDGWPTWQPGGRPRSLERWGRVNWRRKDPAWTDTKGFRGPQDAALPFGSWNRIECVCSGDRIEIWVNGVQVNEASEVFPKEGKILLQCEGSEIFFRRVELRPLGAADGANQALP